MYLFRLPDVIIPTTRQNILNIIIIMCNIFNVIYYIFNSPNRACLWGVLSYTKAGAGRDWPARSQGQRKKLLFLEEYDTWRKKYAYSSNPLSKMSSGRFPPASGYSTYTKNICRIHIYQKHMQPKHIPKTLFGYSFRVVWRLFGGCLDVIWGVFGCCFGAVL